MLETFKIFPLWLTITTVIFVILAAIFSALTRRSLYIHLEDLEKKTRKLVNGDNQGIQPRFINLLQQRFAKASQQIENVNTIALIDGVYHQETITFFNVKIRCEEAEYITKTIPNLLLAFGLLGTFLGITLNLNSISEIINQGGADITDLTNQLQRPLQSMAIAFITSLIGLFCASILTVTNLKYNINLEKNSLLNNLEDYLDNIYKPLVEGDTRLDKAVNKMVDKQTEFLKRFHENVGQVLEGTFKKAADKIADENQKSQKIITQLYENLFDACSLINNGANTFQLSTKSLENQVESMQRMMPIFRQNIESFDNSANLILSASSRIEASKFSENLEKITDNLAQTQEAFTASTTELTKGVIVFNKDSKKATDLALNIYEELKKASESLEESSVLFADSATTIKESQFSEQLMMVTNNLMTIQQPLLEIINILNQTIHPLENNIKTFDASIDKMVEVTPNYQQFKGAIELLDKSANIFINSAEAIKQSKFNEGLAETTNNLGKIQEIFVNAIKQLNEIVKPITTNIKTLEVSSDRMAQLAQNVNKIESNINMINERYLEMTNISRDILLKLGENTVNNNERYSQMTNISRDILLKLGESTVKNTNSYSELFKSLEKINKELEERLKLLEKNEKFMLLLMRKLFENSYNQNKSSSGINYNEEWEKFLNEDWHKMWDED